MALKIGYSISQFLPWILLLPGLDPPPHVVAVDEVLDENLLVAAPALLGLATAPDVSVNELVLGTGLADIEGAAGHHLRVGEDELAYLAEERRRAL